MKLREKISLEEVFGKEYKVKQVEPENNREAVITHFFHNSKKDDSQFLWKENFSSINNFIRSVEFYGKG
jgi:DNA (cytosine-5)-methyltransferase 1